MEMMSTVPNTTSAHLYNDSYPNHHPGYHGNHHHGNSMGNHQGALGNMASNLSTSSLPGTMDSSGMMMRHPLSAPASLNNTMVPPEITPGYNSPTPTSSGVQYFSFSPGNLENLAPSQNFSSCNQTWNGNQPDKRLVVNARQRSRVQNMNEAFRMLKEKVPGLNDEDKNFSKLEVLQCTIAYLQHLYKVLGIDCKEYNKIPLVKERVQQLEKRFVVHGGNVKKRGNKRSRDPY